MRSGKGWLMAQLSADGRRRSALSCPASTLVGLSGVAKRARQAMNAWPSPAKTVPRSQGFVLGLSGRGLANRQPQRITSVAMRLDSAAPWSKTLKSIVPLVLPTKNKSGPLA